MESAGVEPRQQILIVEDEKVVADAIAAALSAENYRVTIVDDGQVALETLIPKAVNDDRQTVEFDLIILDLMLPHVNGLDVCRRLRQARIETPILILSAKSTETDRVVGLEVGADDYLVKPFGMRELIARCRALLRRPQAPTPTTEATTLKFRDLELNLDEHRVFIGNQEISLPPKEFLLLEVFMRSPRQVFSREQLLNKVWGVEYITETKTVDVHIRWLRQKIEQDPSHPEYIITVRGFGYRLG